jgi:hypothetical protein
LWHLLLLRSFECTLLAANALAVVIIIIINFTGILSFTSNIITAFTGAVD